MYSVVFPCKDEEATIGTSIDKAREALKGEDYEIIVVDNNSRDGSARIARSKRVRVILEREQGYGAALKKGFGEAKGSHIIMCDADDTYDLNEIPRLLRYKDSDIVIGNRLNSRMEKDAMPFLHKSIGNPLLSLILRKFFRIPVKDANCGLRIIKKQALLRMNLSSNGMEIASEMLMQASRLKLKVRQVDISYSKRKGNSKLRSLQDGWKHLRLMLLYSPDHLFLIPGLLLTVIGLVILVAMLFAPITLFGFDFYLHPIFLGSLLTIIGYQVIILWLFSKTYMHHYLGYKQKALEGTRFLSLERGILAGSILALLGIAINLVIFISWVSSGFGDLDGIRMTVLGATLIILGMQTIFSSFHLSIIGID